MRCRIGDFSKLGKVSVKTLRYYESESLLVPAYIDPWNGYRYYLPEQLNELGLIREYRSAGFSISEIKEILSDGDPRQHLDTLRRNLEERISKIDSITERISNMSYNYEIKTLKPCTVAYMHGTIPSYADLTSFVFRFAELCQQSNPQLRCSEDYCFVTYTCPEYQEKDIELTYSQQVDEAGKETDEIKFRDLEETVAVCVKHYGSYDRLGEAYAFAMGVIQKEGYEISDSARECYIDGCWNKENEEEWLTEIQIPIRIM